MYRLCVLFGIICSSLCAQVDRGYIVEVGDKAPLFTAKTIDGQIIDIEKSIGKVIMLKFTASWCGVCMHEMPVIEEEVWQKYKDNEDFIMIALTKDTDKKPQREKEIKTIIEKTRVTYPIGIDYNSKIFNMFAEKKAGVTRSIIIDQNGDIAFLTRLFEASEFNEMKNTINKLLSK